MVNMVMEATPQEMITLSGVPFGFALAFAVALYIGVEWDKLHTKLSASILEVLIFIAFAASLAPWAILSEKFGLSYITHGALLVVGLIVIALFIRISRILMKKPVRRTLPPAVCDPEIEYRFQTELNSYGKSSVS